MGTSENSRKYGNVDKINFRELLKPYIDRWYWFALAILIGLFCGYIYLRYSTVKHEAAATVIIKDTKWGGGVSELGAFNELGLGSSFNSVENEIEVLKSRRLMRHVVDTLGLDVKIIRLGDVKDTDIYSSAPFAIRYMNNDSVNTINTAHELSLIITSESDFKLQGEGLEDGTFRFGEVIPYEHGTVTVLKNTEYVNGSMRAVTVLDEDLAKNSYRIEFKIPEEIARSYSSTLDVSTPVKFGSVIDLSIVLPEKQKAKDILNNLIYQYNLDAINDKNIVASNTINFINERLKEVAADLDSVEVEKQRFKDDEGLTDIVAEAELNLNYAGEYDKKITEVETQLQMARYILEYLDDDEMKILPVNSGLERVEVTSAINQYNQAVIQYEKLLSSATDKNPVVQQTLDRINKTRNSIIQSLQNYEESLKINKSRLERAAGQVQAEIAQVPEEERIFRDLERNQSVVEAIYLLLKQKQEETAISLAVTAPKAKIVDLAYASDTPVSPKPLVVYLAALILGFGIPLGIIYARTLLYNKIENRKDIEKKLPNIGLLGEVPKLDKNEDDFIKQNDRSVLAESFRIIRTNLQFKLNKAKATAGAQKILVTSSIQGEGKTFVAYNLAQTLANSGNKVLLLGADIRNPQLHRYLPERSKDLRGVTEFLINDSMSTDDIIRENTNGENLDVILSGAIPPNPAELWLRARVDDLFSGLQSKYDYIVIDSAPTILVTDTFLISERADVTLYVTRADYSDISLLEFIEDTVEDGKLNNITLVLNNVKSTNLGYGNKYGYSYGLRKESSWQKLKKRIGLG